MNTIGIAKLNVLTKMYTKCTTEEEMINHIISNFKCLFTHQRGWFVSIFSRSLIPKSLQYAVEHLANSRFYKKDNFWGKSYCNNPNNTKIFKKECLSIMREICKRAIEKSINVVDMQYILDNIESISWSDGGSKEYHLNRNKNSRYTDYSQISKAIFYDFEPRKDIIFFRDGSFYKGIMDNDMPINGKIIYSNEYVFEGELRNAKPHKGKMFSPDGIIYEGNFTNGIMTHGKMIDKQGNIYEGDLKNWQPQGNGKLFFLKGNITYEGSFECGKPKNAKAKINNLEYYIGDNKTFLNYDQDFNFVKFIKHCTSDTANDALEVKIQIRNKIIIIQDVISFVTVKDIIAGEIAITKCKDKEIYYVMQKETMQDWENKQKTNNVPLTNPLTKEILVKDKNYWIQEGDGENLMKFFSFIIDAQFPDFVAFSDKKSINASST